MTEESADKQAQQHAASARRADKLRERLAQTVEELDRRWNRIHKVIDPLGNLPVTQSVERVAGALAGMVVMGAVVWTVRALDRRQHPNRERWRALVRAWNHPHRLAR